MRGFSLFSVSVFYRPPNIIPFILNARQLWFPKRKPCYHLLSLYGQSAILFIFLNPPVPPCCLPPVDFSFYPMNKRRVISKLFNCQITILHGLHVWLNYFGSFYYRENKSRLYSKLFSYYKMISYRLY